MGVDYKTYLKMQTAGPVYKPEHYSIAEQRTIKYFFANVAANDRILDVGCAIGLGMNFLESLGFLDITGIDLDERKVAVNTHKVILGDIATFDFEDYDPFAVIYCSHALEHFYDASAAIENMKKITTQDAIFFFVLPYPNPNPSPAHWSSPVIGLTVDDKAETVQGWFRDRGFEIEEIVFDDFRESEIWLTMRKK